VGGPVAVIRKGALGSALAGKMAIVCVMSCGVIAKVSRVVGIGWRRYEKHAKQNDQGCHDNRTIHGFPLALMNKQGSLRLGVGRRFFRRADCNSPPERTCA